MGGRGGVERPELGCSPRILAVLNRADDRGVPLLRTASIRGAHPKGLRA